MKLAAAVNDQTSDVNGELFFIRGADNAYLLELNELISP